MSSPAGAEVESSKLTAVEVLGYNRAQLIEYLEENRRKNGTYDTSDLVGVVDLSPDQRNELIAKVRNAIDRTRFSPSDLISRLSVIADIQNDFPDQPLPRRRLPSSNSTMPGASTHTFQASSRSQLIEDGGRPVCSLQQLWDAMEERHDLSKYTALLPWLEHDPDSVPAAEDMEDIFGTQFDEWWEFRKSQWEERGLGDSEEGVSAFVEAVRGKYVKRGEGWMATDVPLEQSVRRSWQVMGMSRQLPRGSSLSTYSDLMKVRLAPHRFSRSFQLRKNPHKQDAWTNWLEYVSYEQRRLEEKTAAVDSREPRFLRSWGTLLRQREEDDARAYSGAGDKAMDDFVREAEPFARALSAESYQKRRVRWAVEQAHELHNEILHQREEAQRSKKGRKRQRDDGAEEGDEHPVGTSSMHAGGAQSMPRRNPQRSTRQSTPRYARSGAPPMR